VSAVTMHVRRGRAHAASLRHLGRHVLKRIAGGLRRAPRDSDPA
jgi:hypothetical protein